jgi:hypothetical protein
MLFDQEVHTHVWHSLSCGQHLHRPPLKGGQKVAICDQMEEARPWSSVK